MTERTIVPQAVTAYKSNNGQMHESLAQAIAVDLMSMPGSGRGQLISNAAAWAIIQNRKYIIELLSALGSDDVVVPEPTGIKNSSFPPFGESVTRGGLSD